MNRSVVRFAVVLGLLSAIGPFAIDMYLPALPSIGADLKADTSQVQMSLMAFFLSLGFGQLVYGPVSDMVGRKAPLYFGLGLFMVSLNPMAVSVQTITMGNILAITPEDVLQLALIGGVSRLITLKAVIGPGDEAKPVLTIMWPDED